MFGTKSSISAAGRDFVSKLLEPVPSKRIGMADQGGYAALKQHIWFSSVNFGWDSLACGTMDAPCVPTKNTKPGKRKTMEAPMVANAEE